MASLIANDKEDVETLLKHYEKSISIDCGAPISIN